MDSKSQLTADIIAKVAEGKIEIVNAAKLLSKSRRTVERYLNRYRQIGIQFVVNQNSGKAPANKPCDKAKRKLQNLIEKKYYDLNLTHLSEVLLENESIQVKRACEEVGIEIIFANSAQGKGRIAIVPFDRQAENRNPEKSC